MNGNAPEVLRGHVIDDKAGEFITKKFQDYFLQTGVSLEYVSTNTLHQSGMSACVGRTFAAMVR